VDIALSCCALLLVKDRTVDELDVIRHGPHRCKGVVALRDELAQLANLGDPRLRAGHDECNPLLGVGLRVQALFLGPVGLKVSGGFSHGVQPGTLLVV